MEGVRKGTISQVRKILSWSFANIFGIQHWTHQHSFLYCGFVFLNDHWRLSPCLCWFAHQVPLRVINTIFSTWGNNHHLEICTLGKFIFSSNFLWNQRQVDSWKCHICRHSFKLLWSSWFIQLFFRLDFYFLSPQKITIPNPSLSNDKKGNLLGHS